MSLALVLFPLDKQFLLDRQMTTNNKIMLDRWKLLSQNMLDDTILTHTAMECQLAKNVCRQLKLSIFASVEYKIRI